MTETTVRWQPLSRMQLVFCGTGWFPVVDAIRQRIPNRHTIRIRDTSRPIVEELRECDVILPSNARIDTQAIAASKNLVLIQQPAVGYEGIDLAAARARGVPVCNAPGGNSVAVAEAALFLILALARKLRAAERSFAGARIGVPLGVELAGKTLGLVGMGGTALGLKQTAAAIGMNVVAVTSKNDRRDFEAMLAGADFVSIHCPLNERTRGLFDRRAFLAMKPGAYLVNCARGPIIDRAALEEALESGTLGGVGLDVYWDEPWDPREAIYARENVITMPHVAGSTMEAFGRIADIVAENIRRVESGELLIHRIA
jgi:phosphoglycerate dehydrogenase-like enzyme